MRKRRRRCDYCLRRRLVDRGNFCRECRREVARVIDKYLDGDPLLPLKVVAEDVRRAGP